MLKNIFIFKGELNRKDYLIQGLIIPLVLIFLSITGSTLLGISIILELGLLLTLYIGFVNALKRARETNASNFLTMFLWLFLTPIASLYLLFAPAKKQINVEFNN